MAANSAEQRAHHDKIRADSPQQNNTSPHLNTYTIPRPADGQLFTPEDKVYDSFSSSEEDKKYHDAWARSVRLPSITRTPPVSPPQFTLSLTDNTTSTSPPAVQDPPLYPSSEVSQSEHPLFGKQSPALTHASPPRPTKPSPYQHSPDRGPYHVHPSRVYPNCLNLKTPEEVYKFYQNSMEENRRMRGFTPSRRLPSPPRSSSTPPPYGGKEAADAQQLKTLDNARYARRSHTLDDARHSHLLTQPAGVSKPLAKSKLAASVSPSTSFAKPAPPKRRSPKTRRKSSLTDSASPQREQTKHKRAAASKKVADADLEWTELPDLAPPVDGLDSQKAKLTVQWNHAGISLDADPDREHLHPQELQIAGTLRLACKEYLYNKRKIFIAKDACCKENKNFTKTAAQGACRIDVNKASQLWGAFERVGWFDAHWFGQS